MFLEFFQSKENNRPSHYTMRKPKGFFALCRYRYEVTFGLYVSYAFFNSAFTGLSRTKNNMAGMNSFQTVLRLQMMSPVEKMVVDFTVLSMMALLTFAIYTSMPTHARLMAARFWYYVTGTVEEVVHNVGFHKSHLRAGANAVASGTEAFSAQAEQMASAGAREL